MFDAFTRKRPGLTRTYIFVVLAPLTTTTEERMTPLCFVSFVLNAMMIALTMHTPSISFFAWRMCLMASLQRLSADTQTALESASR